MLADRTVQNNTVIWGMIRDRTRAAGLRCLEPWYGYRVHETSAESMEKLLLTGPKYNPTGARKNAPRSKSCFPEAMEHIVSDHHMRSSASFGDLKRNANEPRKGSRVSSNDMARNVDSFHSMAQDTVQYLIRARSWRVPLAGPIVYNTYLKRPGPVFSPAGRDRRAGKSS